MDENAINEVVSLGSNRHNDFLHFQMIKLRLPDKHCIDLASYNEFRKKSLFTDLKMILKGGEKLELHSLAVIGKSKLLQSWMNNVTISEPLMTIHAPDFDMVVAKDLLKILYGQDLCTTAKRFNKIKGLAEALGISLSLNERPEIFCEEPQQSVETQPSQEVLTRGASIPLCCWHCSKPFNSPEALQIHMRKHVGEPIVKKTHKCPKCKKVLPSMWKFRQHLITHKQPVNQRLSSRQDHQYAGPVPVAVKRPVQRGDHIYAEAINEENQDQTRTIEEIESVQVFENSTSYQLKEIHTQPRTDHTYTEQNSASEDESCPLPRSSDHMYAESPNKNMEVNLTKSHTFDQRKTRSSGHVVQKKDLTRINVKKDFPNSSSQPQILRFTQNEAVHDQDDCLKIDHLYAVRSKSRKLGTREASKRLASEVESLSKPNLGHAATVTNHELAFVGQPNPDLLSSSSEKKGLIAPVRDAETQPTVNLQEENKDPSSSPAAEGTVPAFKCDDCSKSFTQRYRLSRHVREVHEKVRPYKCRFCPKKFFKPFSLQRHELVHVSHSLWVCPNTKCKKKFRDQSSLTYHTRNKVCTSKLKLEDKNKR